MSPSLKAIFRPILSFMQKLSIDYLCLLVLSLLSFFSCENDVVSSECDALEHSVMIDSSKLNNKVIIIGIDGFRSDALTQETTPFLYALSQRNAYVNLSHLTEEDTYSGPNWSSILTGVHYDKHNVTDNSFDGRGFHVFPTLFNYIERYADSLNTSSIVNWLPINQYALSQDVDFSINSQLNDSQVLQEASNVLLNNDPLSADVLFLHFDQLDAAGHSFGFSSNISEYRASLSILDSYVDGLVGIIDSKRLAGENWLCIVVSDHGGDGDGHGDYNNIHIRETIFIAEHPSLPFKLNLESNMADIAPTVLDFLGITSTEFDCKTDGQSVLE